MEAFIDSEIAAAEAAGFTGLETTAISFARRMPLAIFAPLKMSAPSRRADVLSKLLRAVRRVWIMR